MKKIITICIALLFAGSVSFLLSCRKDEPLDPTPPTMQTCSYDTTTITTFSFSRQDILPSTTDPSITMLPTTKHIIWFPQHKTPLPELFVFLPGTGALPSSYEWIQRTGVLAGYRTIGLAYVNDTSVVNRCIGSDSNCSYYVRLENATGQDVSSQISVDTSNSIQNRLIKLLTFLHTNDPGNGWDNYYNNNELVWENIIFGGHSQGSGQSGFFSKEHKLARVLFFSSPGDTYPISLTEQPPAPWSLELRLTPANRMYCFYHSKETAAQRNPEIFDAIGMSSLGNIVDEGSAAAPFGCTHIITTSYTYIDNHNAHNLPIVDNEIPLDGKGFPIFRDVYMYMLTSK